MRTDAQIDARTDAQPGARAVVPAGPPTGTPGGDGPVRDAAPQPLRDDTPPDGGLPVTAALHADAADAAQRAVGELGGAEVGEKTLLDALDPFRRELRARAADGLPTAWRTAAEAATRAAADTTRLTPARGRAARMGVLGHGNPDAGAVSLALLLTAIGGTLR
ncbi:DAK2 domain-containing protein [Streptomyces sp. A1-5]|uniref:DAK2 domain-containing protein n=1 Tax=Streptomyces sp. A1-5 TaxID=2738410 RepID=UPI001F310366|nr:DAK2 domain-containing protein [Streptomyces sp. A1-5]